MQFVNRVTLVGEIGSSPRIKTTPQGTTYVSFTLSLKETWHDRMGHLHESEQRFTVSIFKNQEMLDNLLGYLKVGQRVYVEGRLQSNRWKDQTGNWKDFVSIRATEFVILGTTEDDYPNLPEIKEETKVTFTRFAPKAKESANPMLQQAKNIIEKVKTEISETNEEEEHKGGQHDSSQQVKQEKSDTEPPALIPKEFIEQTLNDNEKEDEWGDEDESLRKPFYKKNQLLDSQNQRTQEPQFNIDGTEKKPWEYDDDLPF